MVSTTIQNGTFYGNDNETFYVDQFGRVWLVQSVDSSESKEAELQTALPEGVKELSDSITGDVELSDNIFALPEPAKAAIIKLAKETAQQFVDEFNEPLDPATTDWDAEAWQYDKTKLSFREALEDQISYEQAHNLYQETLVAETENLCA